MNKSKEAVDYVNTIIGTAFSGFDKGLEGGGTMPCVNRPFAMTNFVAQTTENKMGVMPYTYESDKIIGFLGTHQPMLWMGDYGYVSVMPQVGDLKVLPKERALSFSHENEITKPFYYSVDMNNDDGLKIKAEISAASRCALFRFTFPKSSASRLILHGINLDTSLNDGVNDYTDRLAKLKGYMYIDKKNNEIIGYNPDRQSGQLGPELKNFKGYFVIKFDKKFDSFGTWDGNQINLDAVEQYGTKMGAFINFKTSRNEEVKVKVATSFISIEQARVNLEKEIPDWDFNKVVKQTRAEWQSYLKRINIKEPDEDKRSIFYTALFHTMLFPREFSEYGRYYSAFDDKVHTGESYNDYSLWDTFRALHPLFTIVIPERVNGMVKSLTQMYKEGGWLPKWPNPSYSNIMIGTHADAVISDAYMKGFVGYDVDLAFEAMMKNATVPPDGDEVRRWGDRDRWTSYEARGGLSYYLNKGYVPIDRTNESVSATIEFGIDDWSIAQVAKKMGKDNVYVDLINRSKNYKHLYNQATGFMAPRNSNGTWSDKPNEGFTEGTKWTYLFGAMHDVEGMIDMMGGSDVFASKLDENFNEKHYRHDNEPGHHYSYLYNYVNQPWKTQELVRKHTSSENYRNAPIGINGNDDCGQTSAWYIFSSLGFYPVTPASGKYVIGAPQFSEVDIQLPGRKTFKVLARNISEKNKYIKEAYLNGHKLKSFFIEHADIVKGGELVFFMTDESVSFIE